MTEPEREREKEREKERETHIDRARERALVSVLVLRAQSTITGYIRAKTNFTLSPIYLSLIHI